MIDDKLYIYISIIYPWFILQLLSQILQDDKSSYMCRGMYTCSWGPSLSKSYCCNSTRNSSLLVPPAAHALCTASGTLIRPLGFRSHKRRNRASTLAYFRKASLSSSVSPSSSAGGASAGT